ncbi:MAG: hypothetical protein ACR2JW_15935 [Thermomicrobiales bacterium]
MYESETEATLRSLRAIRRHLTVVFLAVEQLCRKTAAIPPAQRLCSFATDALVKVKDEVVAIEERLLRRERRDHDLPDQLPTHSPDS